MWQNFQYHQHNAAVNTVVIVLRNVHISEILPSHLQNCAFSTVNRDNINDHGNYSHDMYTVKLL